jgi:glucuronate isomerase
MAGTALEVHPDRLLPADPGTRAIARNLYDRVRQLPLICPHGHVDPTVLLDNRPFSDPAMLLLTPDHYVTRLLHADGVELSALGVGQGELSEKASRQAWRLLCERWHLYLGTPVRYEFTDALRPLLGRYGTHPGFHLVVFTIDETAWSRELAPMAAFYPCLYVGVPWWFLDAPDAIGRFRSAVTETAGFSRTSGFVDDTRAFCSIPARHDMSRRVDASFLARLVAEYRLGEDEAAAIAVELVAAQPKAVFKL